MENRSLTANGASTLASSLNHNVDLFAIIGSVRNYPNAALDKFIEAYAEDPKTALRILLWARDARGGAGERQVFRFIMNWLAENDKRAVTSIMLSGKIPELGRFDDYVPLLCNEKIPRQIRFHLAEQLKVAMQIRAKNAGLIAKWLPRKGKEAAIIRNLMGLSPKTYRKLLVSNTNVVETKMCAKDWCSIDFNQVPSVAMARYTRAFSRNAPEKFEAYRQSLVNGEVKAKAGALFPYDVVRTLKHGDAEIANEQWKALPDFLDGASKILPMVDVSSSMYCRAGGLSSVTCMDVAISLGIYLSERQSGYFKNLLMTFETEPEWGVLNEEDDIKSKVEYVKGLSWRGNTNLQAAFELLLETAVTNNVPQKDMPEYIIIISDMEFDQAVDEYGAWTSEPRNPTNYEAINEKFEDAGYVRPNIIFWNVNARSNNIQVKYDENGTAMITGFSPAIMKSILKAERITPESVMLDTISSKRYDIEGLTV